MSNSAEELAGYKKLLDNGVITEKEFEEKKRELLSPASRKKAATGNSSSKIAAIVFGVIALVPALAIELVKLNFEVTYTHDFLQLEVLMYLPVIASAILVFAYLFSKQRASGLFYATIALAAIGFVCIAIHIGMNFMEPHVVSVYGESFNLGEKVSKSFFPTTVLTIIQFTSLALSIAFSRKYRNGEVIAE